MKENYQKKNHQGKLLVLSAPSGAGKSTLANQLKLTYSQFQVSISYTTRLPRGQEISGVHYHFVSDATFQAMIQNGDFIEYAHVFGKYFYGTARRTVETLLASGKHVLFDIDVEGARNLKKQFGNKCTTIFIHPPSLEELRKRLIERKTENQEAIEMRLETAAKEIAQASVFDYQITNHTLDNSFSEIVQILTKEHFFDKA